MQSFTLLCIYFVFQVVFFGLMVGAIFVGSLGGAQLMEEWVGEWVGGFIGGVGGCVLFFGICIVGGVIGYIEGLLVFLGGFSDSLNIKKCMCTG